MKQTQTNRSKTENPNKDSTASAFASAAIEEGVSISLEDAAFYILAIATYEGEGGRIPLDTVG